MWGGSMQGEIEPTKGEIETNIQARGGGTPIPARCGGADGGPGGQTWGGGRWGARQGVGQMVEKIVVSKYPSGTVWHETTLTSHQSGILYSLIFQ